MQIINDSNAGGRIGESLGNALQMLAQNKLQHIQGQYDRQLQLQQQQQERNRYSQGLQQLPGVTPEAANFIANLNPEERKYALQNLGSLLQLTSPSSQLDQSEGLQALNQGQFQQSQPQQNPLQQLMQSQSSPQQNLQQLAQVLGQNPAQLYQSMQDNQGLQNIGKKDLSMPGLKLSPKKPAKQIVPQAVAQQPQVAGQVPAAGQAIQDIFTSPKEKRDRELLELKKRQIEQQEKASRFKETKAERKEIIEKARAAKQTLHDLNRLEELDKTGKLDTPGYVEFLNRSGLDIPALTNPESEEFQKIANNFTKDAKTYFGGRVSNFEIEQFLKTVPSLSQSPEGRKRVIANLKYINNASLEYNNALKEVMSENKGIPPYDLLEQVDDKVEKKQKSLADRFKADLARPVPKGQWKTITALQAALGSSVGIVKEGLKSAAHGLGAGAGFALGAGLK